MTLGVVPAVGRSLLRRGLLGILVRLRLRLLSAAQLISPRGTFGHRLHQRVEADGASGLEETFGAAQEVVHAGTEGPYGAKWGWFCAWPTKPLIRTAMSRAIGLKLPLATSVSSLSPRAHA